MSPENPSTPPDWDRIAARPAFQAMLKAKSSFVKKSCIFFLLYYFALLILVGYFPDLMKKEVIGRANLAYVFALSQFLMAWTMAFIYVRKAATWDRESKEVLKDQ